MSRGFNRFKENILCAGNPAESKHRMDGGASYSNYSRGRSFSMEAFCTQGLMILLISVIAMLLLTFPVYSKADFNQNASMAVDHSINQSAYGSAYLSGFNEGYKLGVFAMLAQNNATIAREYNVLVQQHNELLNRTLSEEDAESNMLAEVPIPISVPKKPVDPWAI